jgi:hypothetical protein
MMMRPHREINFLKLPVRHPGDSLRDEVFWIRAFIFIAVKGLRDRWLEMPSINKRRTPESQTWELHAVDQLSVQVSAIMLTRRY